MSVDWLRRVRPARRVLRPCRGSGRAEAQPDRRRSRSPYRSAADGAAGRGGAGPCRRRCSSGAVLQGDLDAVAPYAAAVKPQLAFFEALGADGWLALETVCRYASEAGLLVIADGKRGDIGSTARAYAAAFLEPRGTDPPLADALTVNPFLGSDSVEPFMLACRRHGAGVFCLVRTSNAGARDIQDAVLSDGTPVWRHVAGLVREWGEELRRGARAVERRRRRRCHGPAVHRRCQAGDAAGDHAPARGSALRARRPADVARAFTSGPASALVNASRSIIYAYRDDPGRLARRSRGGSREACCRRVGRGGLVAVPSRASVARIAAPVAFLLAATVLVLLVRSGLNSGDTPAGGRAASWPSRLGPAGGAHPSRRHARAHRAPLRHHRDGAPPPQPWHRCRRAPVGQTIRVK